MVATVIWVVAVALIEMQIGFIAIVIGLVIGYAVSAGARWKRSFLLPIISVILAFLAMASSEYFITRHFFIQEYATSVEDVALFLPLNEMVEVVKESIMADPITLLFWGIALFEAFVIPLRTTRK